MSASENDLQKMFRDILIGTVSSVLAALAVTFITGNPWVILVVGVMSAAASFIIRKYRRLLKLMWSGWSAGCYYTYPVGENPKIWRKYARLSFKYLGVSAGTFIDEFREWVQHLPLDSPLDFYFLLMSPEARALVGQEAHKLNVETGDPAVAHEVEITRRNIETNLLALKGLDIYRRGKIKIKLYDEFTPWWLYILDARIALVGILEKGKSGRESPAMTLKKREEYGSPFNAFEYTWERLWEEAKDA